MENLSDSLKCYHNDPSYCYKHVTVKFFDKTPIRQGDTELYKELSDEWIVVLRKLPDTKTNESRDGVVNPLCAKFRADKLFCVKIINALTLKDTSEVTNIYTTYGFYPYNIYTKYIVGKVVVPDGFDTNLDRICTKGIHYFNSLEPAFYYMSMPPDYIGSWKEFTDSGELFMAGKCVNGHKTGYWEKWVNGEVTCSYY